MKKLLIVLFALAAAAPVLAQGADAEPPPIVEASHNAVVAFLRLSPEQVESWDVIYQIHHDAEKPLQEAIAAVKEEIDTLFEAGDPDPAEVGALFIERREDHVPRRRDVSPEPRGDHLPLTGGDLERLESGWGREHGEDARDDPSGGAGVVRAVYGDSDRALRRGDAGVAGAGAGAGFAD